MASRAAALAARQRFEPAVDFTKTAPGGAADLFRRRAVFRIRIAGKRQAWRFGVLLRGLLHPFPLVWIAGNAEMRQDRRGNGLRQLAVIDKAAAAHAAIIEGGPADGGSTRAQ